MNVIDIQILEECNFIRLQNVSCYGSSHSGVLEECNFILLQNDIWGVLQSGTVLEECNFILLQNLKVLCYKIITLNKNRLRIIPTLLQDNILLCSSSNNNIV